MQGRGHFIPKKTVTLEDNHLICVTQTTETSLQLQINSEVYFCTQRGLWIVSPSLALAVDEEGIF